LSPQRSFHTLDIRKNAVSRLCVPVDERVMQIATCPQGCKILRVILKINTNLNERLSTSAMVTNERSFAGVDPHVPREIAPSGECLAT
jgi:hypothetical protein